MATWGTLTWGTGNFGAQNDIDTSVSGIGASFNIGTIAATGEINIGWGSDTWGTETWGQSGLLVDVTGIGLTATLDSVTTKSDVDGFTVTGEEATITQGATEGGTTVDIDVTGEPMTATLQYQEAIVDPTGQELTANDGTADLDANTIAEVSATTASTWGDKSSWGFGVYGNQQIDTLVMSMQENSVDPAPDAEATGQAMAMVQGEETVTGDANVDVTGEAMAANQGQAELDANTIAAVTGQEMTMQENDVIIKGSANVFPTGIGLTMALGTNRTLIWNQVNTGTAPTWTEVDTAA